MNWTWGSIQTKFREAWRYLNTYPWIFIIVAIVIILLAVFRADDTKSSAGMWGWIVISVIMFLYGLSKITGMGLGIFV